VNGGNAYVFRAVDGVLDAGTRYTVEAWVRAAPGVDVAVGGLIGVDIQLLDGGVQRTETSPLPALDANWRSARVSIVAPTAPGPSIVPYIEATTAGCLLVDDVVVVAE
jgi:hypothetical protein